MEKSEIIDRLNGLKRLIGNMENPPFPADVPGDIEALGAASDFIRRAEPEIKPLTLEQLRQMGGQPIWVEQKDTYYKCGWALVTSGKDIIASNGECNFEKANYGKTWLAYARKPEGSETDGRTD